MDMPTNLAIDDDLLQQAFELSGFRTKREAVNDALREYIAYRLRLKSIESFGTFDLIPYEEVKQLRKQRGVRLLRRRK
jgi:hypothetical protein